MPNIFDERRVRDVLLVLLESHGIEPTGVKPRLYAAAGIDSSHPSRIRTTVWRPTELIPGGHAVLKVCTAPQRAAASARLTTLIELEWPKDGYGSGHVGPRRAIRAKRPAHSTRDTEATATRAGQLAVSGQSAAIVWSGGS